MKGTNLLYTKGPAKNPITSIMLIKINKLEIEKGIENTLKKRIVGSSKIKISNCSSGDNIA